MTDKKSKARKIVFVNQATGYLTIDIVNEFVKKFDEVALITGSIRVQNEQLDNKVQISAIIKYSRGKTFLKAATWIFGTIQVFILLCYRYRDYEIVFFTVPPTAYLLAPLLNSRYSIIVYDLYPDAIRLHGLISKGIIYRWWAKRNSKIFSKAFRLYTLSEKMKEGILLYSPHSKVNVIFNWSAFSGYEKIGKSENRLISENKLQGKFIVQYSGNIGYFHNVEILVNLAELFRNDDNIVFNIIGRGERVQYIRELIIRKNLNNCIMLDFRKDEDLYDSLSAADLAVVTLDDRTPNVSVPSKIYNILAAGKPLLAIASKTSSLSDLVSEHGNGCVFESADIEGMYEYLLKMKNNYDLLFRLSQNSYNASQLYTKANAKLYMDFYIKE